MKSQTKIKEEIEMELKTAWDFVEMYYPNYYSSDEIALNDDLQKIVDHEETEGDCAHEKYLELEEVVTEEYGADLTPKEIDSKIRMLAQFQLNGVNEDIYKTAIEGFIQQTQERTKIKKYNGSVLKAIEVIEEKIKKFKEAQIYTHGYSRTPLSDRDKETVFDHYRGLGYIITQKTNSHGVDYFVIS